jgi:hypothetical protein
VKFGRFVPTESRFECDPVEDFMESAKEAIAEAVRVINKLQNQTMEFMVISFSSCQGETGHSCILDNRNKTSVSSVPMAFMNLLIVMDAYDRESSTRFVQSFLLPLHSVEISCFLLPDSSYDVFWVLEQSGEPCPLPEDF